MTDFGNDLIEAMEEAAAYVQGDPGKTTTRKVVVPDDVDVLAIRQQFRLSRARFCQRFGLDARAVQDWEQHRRRPDRNARILPCTIARHPEAVEDVVSTAA
jgi:putative transcriptional regulator